MNKFLGIYFIFCLFFFSFFASGFLDSQDGLQYLTIARRMYYDKTVEMPDSNFNDGQKNIHMNTFKGKDGKRYPATGLGYSLALLPAVAVEDLLLSSQHLQPIEAFPLQNDWPVLFVASMTNAFFGALLALFLAKFLILYKFKLKEATFLAFLFMIGTNLFIYTKHSFAHMMFTSFLLISFYYLKKFFIESNRRFLIFSVASFGVVMISYNSSFMFTLPAIGLFYLLHIFKTKKTTFFSNLTKIIIDLIISLITLIPFYLLNNWYLSFRGVNEVGAHIAGSYLSWLKPYVFLEGFWGLLFSPGKSIFLFSPVLLILFLFWFKIDFKKYFSEIVSFLTLFFTYLLFIATAMGSATFLVWHGDSSYGSRYMIPTLPFLLILVAFVYKNMSQKTRKYVFYPLIILGFLVQIPGILLPYQIRFGGLESDVYINETRFNVSEYGNIIPRYSPVFSMSKKLAKRVVNIKQQFDHGEYNLKLVDGFDYPFDLGWSVWRKINSKSLVSINNKKNEINNIAFQIRNHQIDETSSYSAQLKVNDEVYLLEPSEEKIIELEQSDISILEITNTFVATDSGTLKKKQVLFLQAFWINNQVQNLKTLDYPYVSPYSKELLDIEYTYWGNIQTDPWALWHMHSGVYEQSFDLWWLRPLHYWDIPRQIFYLGILNFLIVIVSGLYLIKVKD